jgi:hypothetical protein
MITSGNDQFCGGGMVAAAWWRRHQNAGARAGGVSCMVFQWVLQV